MSRDRHLQVRKLLRPDFPNVRLSKVTSTRDKLKAECVTRDELKAECVTRDELKAECVTRDELKSESVTHTAMFMCL